MLGDFIVDTHVHIWINHRRYPWGPDIRERLDNGEPPPEDKPVSELLSIMDQNGVGKAVIVQPRHYLWDNRYFADVIKEYPDRIMGVCLVDPMSESAADDLSRWVIDYNFCGLRLSPHWLDKYFESPVFSNTAKIDALFDRASELGVPMTLYFSTEYLSAVTRYIERHQGKLDIVLDHLAGAVPEQPESVAMVLNLARFPRVYLKVSELWSRSGQPYPFSDAHDFFKTIYDAFGPQKLMWGTNWPGVDKNLGYGRALSLFRDEIGFLSEDDKGWILGKTALKVWRFKT